MKVGILTLMTLVLVGGSAIPKSVAGNVAGSGSICRGLNPGSESGLSWNYTGVKNSSSRDRWVVCAISQEVLSETQDNALFVAIANYNNFVREVTCHFRFLSYETDEWVTETRRIAISSNDTESETLNETNNLIVSPTVTCKLPRNTGIVMTASDSNY